MKHVLASLALLTACTTMVEPDIENVEAPRRPPIDPSCDVWGCGTNGATLGDGLIFDALDSDGLEPNRGGLKIVGAVTRWGAQVRLHAVGHILYGTPISGIAYDYQGDDLVGTVITLAHPDKGNYEVLISAFSGNTLRYWAGAPEVVPFFELKTRKAGIGKFDEYACRAELTTDPLWASAPHGAIIFAGDHYDPYAMRVEDRPLDDHWFNIACAATTPAKMHLMRYTNAAAASWYGDYSTTWRERTAMVKMYAADYCGDGSSFTLEGTRLSFDEHHHWRTPSPDVSRVEALWTENGAECLGDTRLGVSVNEVSSACGRTFSKCDTRGWDARTYLISAKPRP